MAKHFLTFFFFAVIFIISANAQPSLNNRHCRNFTVEKDTILIDSFSIVPGSVLVSQNGNKISDSLYILDCANSILIWKGNKPVNIFICYRTLNFSFRKKYFHKDIKIIEPRNSAMVNPFAYMPSVQNTDFIDKEGLNIKGNISRGIGFGNAQSLVVNSNLNMQISGKLNNDIDITAAISDDNNPVQPEGNTQQLQDFDKVYIQLSKNNYRTTLGDFEMKRPADSYFLNYNKKSRGLSFTGKENISKKITTSFGAEGAVSRGRFARNIINGNEGTQGPYRLKGTSGEIFIIIISGTEAVYINGEKMQRGEQNDYIIDYNTGEITFMPKRLITQYSRIVVEFQYSDRNYARTVYTGFNDYKIIENFSAGINFYSEQDNQNQPFQQQLSEDAQKKLSEAGNDFSKTIVQNVTETSFDITKILYIKRDTTVNGNPYSIFLFSNNSKSDSVFYIVNFSAVGNGNGNYIIGLNSANGRVFQWVAPLNGKPQGSYEPVTQLITPKQMQMLTANANYKIDSTGNINFEYAHSNFNRNTFSEIDKNNDGGNGIKISANKNFLLQKNKRNNWKLATTANVETVDKNFRYVERYRNVEFDRTWNRTLQNQIYKDTGYNEVIGNASVALVKSGIFMLTYNAGMYNRNNSYKGINNNANMNLHYKKYSVNASGTLTDVSSDATRNSVSSKNNFHNYKTKISHNGKYITVSGNFEDEKSIFSAKNSDSLYNASYNFTSYGMQLQQGDSMNWNWLLDVNRRIDALPKYGTNYQSTDAKNILFTSEKISEKGNRLKINFAYRILNSDSNITNVKPENTLLSRFEYDVSFLKRAIVFNTFYQLENGRELKRQYSYLAVQPGNGVYQWNDYNHDGIQQLNEFEVAAFKDKAIYIKVFLPTTDYIKSFVTQLNQTISLTPSAIWKNSTGKIKKFLSFASNITSFKIDRRVTQNPSVIDFANPFLLGVADTSLVSLNSFVRNTLFINRSGTVWSVELNFADNRNRQLLTNGIDTRIKTEKSVVGRYNFNSSFSANLQFNNGEKSLASQFFTQRNYDYIYNELKPKISWQRETRLRLSIFMNIFNAKNKIIYGGEKTFNTETGIEMKYNFKENATLNAKYSFNKINYSGDVNSPLAFDMLNGLLNGNNSLWNISLQQRISKNTQLNITYDGRKAGENKPVHIARLEARYIF